MKAVVYEGPGRIEVKSLPEPRPGPEEVVLRVFYCGVCETDVALYRGAWKVPPGIALGHMGGGEVVEMGPEVDGLRIGDRVALDPRVSCGICLMCRGGHATLCEDRVAGGLGVFIGVDAARDRGHRQPYHGLLAEFCCVPARACYPLPDSVSDHQSAAIEGVAFSVRCMRGAGLRLGDNAVVIGAADFCLEWLMWAKQLGAQRVAVVEPVATRRRAAARLGADLVVDPGSRDALPKLRRLMPFGADLVGLYPSFPGALRFAHEIVRPRGHIQVLICYDAAHLHDERPLLPVLKEIRLSYPGLFEAEPWRGGRARGDFALAVEMVAAGRIDVEGYVTRVVAWEEIDRICELAFDRLPDREVKVRVRVGGR